MSHIFDALQRSESERSGADVSSLPTATELLERAERLANSRWGHDTRDSMEPEPSVVLGPGLSSPDFGSRLSVNPADRLGSQDVAVEDGEDLLGRCQTLKLSLPEENRLVSVAEGDTPAAEAFRLLSVRLRHLRRERSLQKLLITSTIPQEGKSIVSANLACALSSGTRQKTLLLEGDIRRPSLSKVFGLKEYPGISEWLEGKRTLLESIYQLEPAGIWFLPAGHPPLNPLELLESKALPAAMVQLSEWFDWIIIDSPPVLPLADTSVWMRLAEGILLVVRQGTTQKGHLKKGIEGLESSKVLGAVLNASRSSTDNDYYSYRQ